MVPKHILYAIEREIAAAYQLSYVRIFPKYTPSLFECQYLPEALTEANREYTASNGFFNDYTTLWGKGNRTLTIYIPFDQPGIMLLDIAGTGAKISEIIKREFDVDIEVTIEKSEDFAEKNAVYDESYQEQIAKENQQIENMRIEARNNAAAEKNDAAAPEVVRFKRVMTLHPDLDPFERIEENAVRTGLLTFDTSEPDFVIGPKFDLSAPTPIRNLTGSENSVFIRPRFLKSLEGIAQGDTVNIVSRVDR